MGIKVREGEKECREKRGRLDVGWKKERGEREEGRERHTWTIKKRVGIEVQRKKGREEKEY